MSGILIWPAIEAIKKGLRYSTGLNPKVNKGKELITLQIMLSNTEVRDKQIKSEILGTTVEISSINKQEYEYPMTCKASTDPDIMYIHEAMREKDKEQFIL